ncbi:MAG: TetR/AcrR family transcriptional regulator [Allorhizobium sp.]
MNVLYIADMSIDQKSHLAATRSPGRPREFDMDEALDKAITVFCERGYHAASINDLTAAMELTAGSVYKAFKDKRAVFLAAFDRYKLVRDGLLTAAIAPAQSGRERLRLALTFYAESAHGDRGRRGCLVVGSAAELAVFDGEVAERVAASIARNERRFYDFIREGQADGSIRADIDAIATARFILCLQQGMSLVGKTGRQRPEMVSLVDIAMRVFD